MCCSLDVLERSTLGGTLFALCFLRCAGFHIPTVHANARAVHSRLSSLQDCDVCSELCRVGLEVGFTCHRQWFVSEHRVLLLTALSSESHLQRCWGTALWCPQPSAPFCLFLTEYHCFLFMKSSLELVCYCSEGTRIHPLLQRRKFGNLAEYSACLKGKLRVLCSIRKRMGCYLPFLMHLDETHSLTFPSLNSTA